MEKRDEGRESGAFAKERDEGLEAPRGGFHVCRRGERCGMRRSPRLESVAFADDRDERRESVAVLPDERCEVAFVEERDKRGAFADDRDKRGESVAGASRCCGASATPAIDDLVVAARRAPRSSDSLRHCLCLMAWRLDLSACNRPINVVVAFADDRDERGESVAVADDRDEGGEPSAFADGRDERGESVALPAGCSVTILVYLLK